MFAKIEDFSSTTFEMKLIADAIVEFTTDVLHFQIGFKFYQRDHDAHYINKISKRNMCSNISIVDELVDEQANWRAQVVKDEFALTRANVTDRSSGSLD